MAEIGRFQVMALLQAARAIRLGLKLAEAKSWGLNRAIFYAAAKRGFKHKPSRDPEQRELDSLRRAHRDFYILGGEKAMRARGKPEEGLRFLIGGKIQSPQDFDRQIRARFPAWKEAWAEARTIIRESDPGSLQNPGRFYKNIYKPRRDELIARWSQSAPEQTNVVSLDRFRSEAVAKRKKRAA